MKACTPMFCRPMEFIMPAAVSMMRGAALPSIGAMRESLGHKAANATE